MSINNTLPSNENTIFKLIHYRSKYLQKCEELIDYWVNQLLNKTIDLLEDFSSNGVVIDKIFLHSADDAESGTTLIRLSFESSFLPDERVENSILYKKYLDSSDLTIRVPKNSIVIDNFINILYNYKIISNYGFSVNGSVKLELNNPF